jgi:hypothetical protein
VVDHLAEFCFRLGDGPSAGIHVGASKIMVILVNIVKSTAARKTHGFGPDAASASR